MERKGEKEKAEGESKREEGEWEEREKKEKQREKKEKEREKNEKEREKNVKENPWWEQKRRWEQEELEDYLAIDLRDLTTKTTIETNYGIDQQEKSFQDLYAFTAQIYAIFRQVGCVNIIIIKNNLFL